MSPGGLHGLQIRWGALEVSSVGSTPMRSRHYFAYHLLTTFLDSRKDGLSPRTIDFYRTYLTLAKGILYPGVTGQQIRDFLKSLTSKGLSIFSRRLNLCVPSVLKLRLKLA